MKNGYTIHNADSAHAQAKSVLEEVMSHYKFVPNALGAMAESPETVKAYLALDELVQQNSLSDLQRHIVFLTITREYDCSYCVAAHTAFAQMGQVDAQAIEQLRAGTPLTNPGLRALQEFTAKLVQTGCHVSEQDIELFLASGHSRRQVLDIITMMANKLIAIFANRIMGTDLDEMLKPAEWNKVA